MPERRKFRVYLAGPISHCNESQKRRWRETVKHEYEAKMTFLDPVENLSGPEASAYEVVAALRRSGSGSSAARVHGARARHG